MAAITPATIFPNITSDGSSVTIPLTDLVGLSSAEVDPVTGNGSELLRILCETAYARIEALDAVNQPTQITWNKPAPSGISANVFRQSYTFGFNLATDPTVLNMAAES